VSDTWSLVNPVQRPTSNYYSSNQHAGFEVDEGANSFAGNPVDRGALASSLPGLDLTVMGNSPVHLPEIPARC